MQLALDLNGSQDHDAAVCRTRVETMISNGVDSVGAFVSVTALDRRCRECGACGRLSSD